jgi:hypothetical protein
MLLWQVIGTGWLSGQEEGVGASLPHSTRLARLCLVQDSTRIQDEHASLSPHIHKQNARCIFTNLGLASSKVVPPVVAAAFRSGHL